MDIGSDMKRVRRDPRVAITGRRCTTCPNNAPLAFCITERLPNLPPIEIVICTKCVLRICETLSTNADAVITIDAAQTRIHLA